ncbi:phage baseplate upper protein [Enterococcus casseliflavus]|nr:phage baseplate upper protein [Enterococcus casseliflavus]
MNTVTHRLTLSVTEPNNDVGLIKVRQGDDNTIVFDVRILEESKIKSFRGLKPFFCLMARELTGQGVSEEPVSDFDEVNGTLKYTLSANAFQMIGRNEAYFSFRKELSKGRWSEQFSTRSFFFMVEKSIYTQPFKDSNYWWTFRELYRQFIEYQESGKESWLDFIDKNKEILESIDPGGKLLSEILNARNDLSGDEHDSLNERLVADLIDIENKLLEKSYTKLSSEINIYSILEDEKFSINHSIEKLGKVSVSDRNGALMVGTIDDEKQNVFRFELAGEIDG